MATWSNDSVHQRHSHAQDQSGGSLIPPRPGSPDNHQMGSVFNSPRERRLWTWTAVVVVGIYSSLGLARTLADQLRDRDLVDGVFVFAFGIAVVAVAEVGLRARPGGLELGVFLGVVAVYLMVFARMGIPEERTHLFEYGIVTVLIHEALRERAANGRGGCAAALLAIGIGSALGVLDELIQGILPTRVFDPVDLGFNVLAAVMAVSASSSLRWARTRATDGSR